MHHIIGMLVEVSDEPLLFVHSTKTPKQAVFAGSMQLLAGIKLCTGRVLTNHPHYEDKDLRDRTRQVPPPSIRRTETIDASHREGGGAAASITAVETEAGRPHAECRCSSMIRRWRVLILHDQKDTLMLSLQVQSVPLKAAELSVQICRIKNNLLYIIT